MDNIESAGAPDPVGARGGGRMKRAELKVRLANIVAITLPLCALVVAITLLWGVAFNWVYLALLGAMYFLTAVGITVGYHRYFTHRSFKTPRAVEAVLGVLGSMAAEGPILQWVALHRKHHQHSDKPDDPHSPHTHGAGFRNIIRGWWHSHVGWMMGRPPSRMARYVNDLRRDRLVRWMSHLFPVWVLVGLLIPGAVGGLVAGGWTGFGLGVLWGGLVRILLVHHVTWSVNSVCHLWGTRPFRSHDESRNNPIVGVLALGEGWHNNHHAFPSSARHGLRWWEFDAAFLIIRGLSLVGLASDVRVPSRDRIESKRLRP